MDSTDNISNAEKMLFATDLVDYIIVKTRPSFVDKTINILARADPLRNFAYNRFNKTFRRALKIIDVNQDSAVFNDFVKLMGEDGINTQSFIEYANNYRQCNLDGGFHPKSFLMYCDRVANMAGYFLSFGVFDAADVAVELIVQAFPKSVMDNSSWNKIKNAAAMLEMLGNNYYKDDTSSDSSSESIDEISSEDEDSSDSITMDFSVSSPEEICQYNLDYESSPLNKVYETKIAINVSSITTVYKPEEVVNAQSSDSAGSSILPCVTYSTNDGNYN